MNTLPLCVDLDGTLINTDMLYESLLHLLKRNPLYIFLLPWWLLQGRAALKHHIALRIQFDPVSLPYHHDFLHFLRTQHKAGRALYLVTASHHRIAQPIADHLQLFSAVLASDDRLNLKGEAKGKHLQAHFPTGFAYAGNAPSDKAVWQYARSAVLVNASPTLTRQVENMLEIESVFPPGKPWYREIPNTLRLHQWVKNLLIFVPLLAAHAFKLGAFLGAFTLAWFFLPPLFLAILASYYLLTMTYSLWLKRIVLVDVFSLALLFTVRVIAGVVVMEQQSLSHWLVSFSVFFFLCLAFVKRHSEMLALRLQQKSRAKGRGYVADDLEILATLGVASGFVSVLVFALYINSDQVRVLYSSPDLLWAVCLLLLYWISRVWMIAHRGLMHDDPIVFAIRDRTSYLVAGLMLVIGLGATYYG